MGLRFDQTVSVDEAAERRAIREDAEDAAGMHEADATPERARGAPERVEESGECLGRVHGVEDDAFEPGQLEHRVELVLASGGAPDPLVAVEQSHLGRRPHGEAEAATRALDPLGDVRAHARAPPRDRYADDLARQPGDLLGHEEAGVAAAAERGDGDGVERRRAVAVLLGDLPAGRGGAEGAHGGGAPLPKGGGAPAPRALPPAERPQGPYRL